MKILFVKDNAICRTVVTKSLQELAGFDDRPPNFLTATAQTQEPLTTQRHQIQPPRAAIFNGRQHPRRRFQVPSTFDVSSQFVVRPRSNQSE